MKTELIGMAPLFMGLSDEEQEQLAGSFAEHHRAADTQLFRCGERSDALFLLSKGFARLTTAAGQTIATLGPGSVLGEDSLFRAATYEATAVAVSDVQYWALTDRQLRDILVSTPSIGIKLSRSFGVLIAQMEDYLVQLLGRTAELSILPRNTLQAVAARLKPIQIASGQSLYATGDAPKGLFIVQHGAVQVRPETEGSAHSNLRRAEAGAVLGAAALLTNKPLAEAVVATDETLVWQLTAQDFQEINARHPGLRRSLGRSVRAPLSRTDRTQAVARLAGMPLFAGLPPQTLEAIAQRMVLQHAPAGERVYRVGESGDALFLIDSGEIELTAENSSGVVEELARVGTNGFFGEMNLITGQIRTEDATAIRNTNLWVLGKTDLDGLTGQYPGIGKAMSDAIALRLAAETHHVDTARFRRFAMLATLDDAELGQVVKHLTPDRFRAGEQILRASAPATCLYLVDNGEVRFQPLVGAGWLLGPGETFGERALLSSQPHNATVTAETDVDVWMLNKEDFEVLTARYPSLAINMSRVLSDRLERQGSGVIQSAPVVQQISYAAPQPRRRAVAAEGAPAQRRRLGFGQWYRNLSTWGKVRFALLLLLLVWLVLIAAPWALFQVLRGTSLADAAGTVAASQGDAIGAVYRFGSYEVAAMDSAVAQEVAMVDSQVPPTPTYTPPPTATAVPTTTPLPTNTPTAVPPTATPVPFVAAAVQEVQEPTPEPEIQAAAAPARAWDPRLDQLGVSVEEANVPPGQPYWRLVDAVWWDEQQSGGKHHIYVEVLDENGDRIVGQPVTIFWGDGSYTSNTEDKSPPDYAFNYQMYAAGYAYNVKVEGLPGEIVKGAGMGSLSQRFYGIHTSFLLTYQKSIK